MSELIISLKKQLWKKREENFEIILTLGNMFLEVRKMVYNKIHPRDLKKHSSL